MKYFFLLLSILLFLCRNDAKSQDAHFNEILSFSLNANPATTGVFNGNYRILSIFRKQWQSINRNNVLDESGIPSFLTYAESVDLRFNVGAQRSGGLGIGIVFWGDMVGIEKTRSRSGLISASYIQPLNRKATQFLSIGLQGGIIQTSSDYADLRFGNRNENPLEFNRDIDPGDAENNKNYKHFDVSAGLVWCYMKDERTNISLGTAVHHLNRPVQFFPEDAAYCLPARFTIHAVSEFKIIKHISLVPALHFMRQGSFNELNLGTSAKVFFRGEKPMRDAVLLGLCYRVIRGGKDFLENEAVIINTKIHFNKVVIGASYNCLVSELAKGLTGGFELSIAFSGKVGKNKDAIEFPRW